MRNSVPVLLVLGLAVTAVRADWPEPADPRPSSLPTSGTALWANENPEDIPVTPLADFRHKVRKLQEERDALKEERKKALRWLEEAEPAGSADITRLHYRLSGLLSHMTTVRGPSLRPGPGPIPPPGPKKAADESPPLKDPAVAKKEIKTDHVAEAASPSRFSHVPDPLTLANALFRAGNFKDALIAYRMVPQEGLKATERMPIKYMIATCLRKEGKGDQAVPLYLEVANSPGDEHLAACAQWQIQAWRWHQDMTNQLHRIRERRRALETAP